MREFFGDLLSRIPFLEALPFGDVDQIMDAASEHLGGLDRGLEGLFPEELPVELPIDSLADLSPLQ